MSDGAVTINLAHGKLQRAHGRAGRLAPSHHFRARDQVVQAMSTDELLAMQGTLPARGRHRVDPATTNVAGRSRLPGSGW